MKAAYGPSSPMPPGGAARSIVIRPRSPLGAPIRQRRPAVRLLCHGIPARAVSRRGDPRTLRVSAEPRSAPAAQAAEHRAAARVLAGALRRAPAGAIGGELLRGVVEAAESWSPRSARRGRPRSADPPGPRRGRIRPSKTAGSRPSSGGTLSRYGSRASPRASPAAGPRAPPCSGRRPTRGSPRAPRRASRASPTRSRRRARSARSRAGSRPGPVGRSRSGSRLRPPSRRAGRTGLRALR